VTWSLGLTHELRVRRHALIGTEGTANTIDTFRRGFDFVLPQIDQVEKES
jgi:hypothetical protein